MQLTGELLLGAQAVRGAAGELRAFDPARGVVLEPAFGGATAAQVRQACDLAAAAFDTYRATAPELRAQFLEAIAARIEMLGDTLIVRAMAETALPRARLEGERARTIGQLRLFADVLRAGYWHGATIDRALPERAPLPRPDLRRRNIAIGPVAVFGASNFPLAFSVAGGDTAAALAAGCPVVVKGHPAHPGTSELVGRAVQMAVQQCALPEGVFSLVQGAAHGVGEALVDHPAIRAVGFTGSRGGGLALMRRAAGRPEPIPVYAEMSSINPVYLLPGALRERSAALGEGFVESLTQGVGQFCTNPGLLIAVDGPDLATFVAAAQRALSAKVAGTMLTAGIHAAYQAGMAGLEAVAGVEVLARGQAGDGPGTARASLFATTAECFFAQPRLQDEIFGPASLLVRCRDFAEVLQVSERLDGQLTATLQMTEADTEMARRLLPLLERKAGRILANGFPTGVEVSHAMVHGGPFPATSDSRTTSVGSAAIERFLRPVCYQNLPDVLLPAPVIRENPLGLLRMTDGKFSEH